MLSISLANEEPCSQVVIKNNHCIQSLAQDVTECLVLKLQASSAQLYLYSGESQVLKNIYSSSSSSEAKNQTLSVHIPKNDVLFIENDHLIFPISLENHLLGIIKIESIEKSFIQQKIEDLKLLHYLLGYRFFTLIESENRQNKNRIINEHIISFELSPAGKITQVSEAFLAELGYSRKELIGHSPEKIFYPDKPSSTSININPPLKPNEVLLQKKNGEPFWVSSELFPLKKFLEEDQGSLYLQQNISQQKIIEDMAIKDELTGLYNRRFFNQIFDKELENANRYKHYLAFMIIDIDNFKKYNDTYGHQQGDAVLAKVAQTISSCFKRKGDFTFRLGGEEFGVVCNITQPEDSEMLANLARKAIENLAIAHTENPYRVVTVSAGIYNVIPSDIPPDKDEIYKSADIALYEAKEKGRNRVVIAGLKDDIELFSLRSKSCKDLAT